MLRMLGVLSICSIISIMGVVLQFKAILLLMTLIVVIIYVIYSYKCTEKAFWLIYFVILSVPISKNRILDYITINIGDKGINLLQISVAVLFGIIILKGRKYKSILGKKANINYLVFITLCFFYFFIGLLKHYNAIADFMMYAFQFMLFYCAYKINEQKDDIYKLLNVTLYGLTCNSIITFIMYLTNQWTFWGIEYDGGRFGGNYLTLFIVTGSYIIFIFYNKEYKVKKPILIIATILSVILMALSQNRTNPIALLVSCCIILLINLKNKSKSRNKFAKILLLFLITAVMIVSASALFRINSDFINRFKKIASIEEDSNLKTRSNTNKYHLALIMSQPLGNGFGTTMTFIDSRNVKQFEDSLNIDNSYINIARKAGVITLLFYIVMIVSPIRWLLRKYSENQDMIYLSISIAYVMLLIASTIFTSQSIHSYAVSSFIWVFIGYSNSITIKKYDDKLMY